MIRTNVLPRDIQCFREYDLETGGIVFANALLEWLKREHPDKKFWVKNSQSDIGTEYVLFASPIPGPGSNFSSEIYEIKTGFLGIKKKTLLCSLERVIMPDFKERRIIRLDSAFIEPTYLESAIKDEIVRLNKVSGAEYHV
ncbi:hypothetical protein HYT23_00555 [Candidatus Pacearchaeota archaeon]|nr:hypothetical protein [Candidatus Pacearchaeota archaeon]